MGYPNTLIFVDIPSPDPAATAAFYAEIFNWEVEGRPEGIYHRIVPGGEFLLSDGTESGVGNLHIGIYNSTNARPHPDPGGVEPRINADPKHHRTARFWILVSDDDNIDRILSTAESLGATILWRDHYWAEFNGFNAAFADPWGNTCLAWVKGGDEPQIPEGATNE